MNLSETAFVELGSDNDVSDTFATATSFRLRWFTPTIEVPLCGHATLAAAAALFDGAGNTASQLRFATLSGELRVSRHAATGELCMDLPLLEAQPELPSPDFAPGSALVAAALQGAAAAGVALDEILYECSLRYLVIVLKPSDTSQNCVPRAVFEALQPDVGAMHAAHKNGGLLVGVILTTAGGDGYDFLSRFFGPWAGIDEDPVTGSAHSVLGPLWARKLGRTDGKLAARQCSRRGGELGVEVAGGRVTVRGQAVMVVRGELLLPAESRDEKIIDD